MSRAAGISVQEAAARFGFSIQYIRKLCRKGALRAYRKDGCWRITGLDYLERSRPGGDMPAPSPAPAGSGEPAGSDPQGSPAPAGAEAPGGSAGPDVSGEPVGSPPQVDPAQEPAPGESAQDARWRAYAEAAGPEPSAGASSGGSSDHLQLTAQEIRGFLGEHCPELWSRYHFLLWIWAESAERELKIDMERASKVIFWAVPVVIVLAEFARKRAEWMKRQAEAQAARSAQDGGGDA